MPLIAQVLAIFIVSVLSFFFWFKKNNKNSVKPSSSKSLTYKNLLSISIPMLITSSMGMIMGWTDIVMLGIYANEEDVGIYNIALKVSMITSIALVAINTIAAPKFAELWGNNDIEGLSKIIKQSTKLVFWLSFPTLLIFAFFPSWILSIFGDKFTAGALPLVILSFGQFINSASGSVAVIMNMTNHQKILQYLTIISAMINILLNFILIPRYGILGAAISTTISGIFWNIICVYCIKVKLNIPTWYIPLIKN
jgi:O-antigen/teichoic acid export membrane protein